VLTGPDPEQDARAREPAAPADPSATGEWVTQDEACRLFGVSGQTWRKWQRQGRLPAPRYGRSPSNRPCKMYAVGELAQLLARLRDPQAPRRVPGNGRGGAYHVPDVFVRQRDAYRMFGVDLATWRRWEREGRITCGQRLHGGPKLYPRVELQRLLAECGRYSPPYPDPERPGCYRVPLGGLDMKRREAIIDTADLPLVAGKRWHWTTPGPGKRGQVRLSDPKGTTRLHQVIMGVSGRALRVGHRNEDPLDCRRANLFVRNKQEQGRGARKVKARRGRPCSSRFKGVVWDTWTGKWKAGIVVDARTRSLGRFRDEIAAAQAYDDAARELFGAYARLNFPEGVDAFLAQEAAAARDLSETREAA
jgi:hypothetical protein